MDQKEKETIILEVLTLVRVTGVMRHQELYSALEQLRKGGLPPVAYNELPYFIEENVKEIGVQWCAIYMGGTPLKLDAFFFSKIGTAGQIVLDQRERYQSEQDRFIARPRELANVVKANKKAILALHDLIKSLKNLVSLIDEVGEETKWKDGVETDRVFASYEFDEARAALKKAGVK